MVDIELLPGDISIHHPFLVHGSQANTSATRRCGLTIRYIPTSTRVVLDADNVGSLFLFTHSLARCVIISVRTRTSTARAACSCCAAVPLLQCPIHTAPRQHLTLRSTFTSREASDECVDLKSGQTASCSLLLTFASEYALHFSVSLKAENKLSNGSIRQSAACLPCRCRGC